MKRGITLISFLIFVFSAGSDAIVVYSAPASDLLGAEYTAVDDRGNEPYMFAVKNPAYTAPVLASWYNYSLEGALDYSSYTATAASRDYPRGTQLIISRGGKSVVVRVNDYGPEEWTGRDIDLSSYAFSQLAPLELGVIEVIIK